MTTTDRAEGAPPEAVQVAAGAGGYEVLVGAGLLGCLPELLADRVPAHRYAVISDETVAALYGAGAVQACSAAGLDATLFTFPAGEASKTRKRWSILTDALLEAGFGRDAAVVAVGGGVTGDLAGFVAATYLRGVPVVQVPTSLVAMIDASVGGKTGVDVAAGKNLVGAFHAPALVVADPETVRTLPGPERAGGFVEALKHGAVLDAGYLADLVDEAPALLAADVGALQGAVLRSVRIKADVVTRDEREGGLRQVLNFGHTVGHGLEAASGYGLGHGRAVGVGMEVEAELGERLGATRAGTRDALAAALDAFGVRGLGGAPTPPVDAVLSFLGADKKARRGRPRYVLLERPGCVHAEGGWSHEVPAELVADTVAEVLRDAR